MAKNQIIKPRVANDIDAIIDRVLRGLGNPEPPLDLRVVRELLELDRDFYSAEDPGLLQETVSKLRIGAKQVLLRPSLLIDAVRKFDLRALYIPDQKRILIDSSQPQLKHRWNEAHEIGHSIIPWHEGAMLGDDEHTLVPSCHQQLEDEANFAAARLLFLQNRFREEARDHPNSIETLKILAKQYGNTNASTLWRCVEVWGEEKPVVGLMTRHPQPFFRPADFDPLNPCRHFIQSPPFASRFSNVAETSIFDQVVEYCSGGKGGPLGGADVLLTDDNGSAHVFEFESYSFYHWTYTLGIYKAPYSSPIAVP